MPQMESNLLPRKANDVEQQLARKRDRKVEIIDLNAIPRIGATPVSIGQVRFEFYIFDLETEVLRLAMDDVQGLKPILRRTAVSAFIVTASVYSTLANQVMIGSILTEGALTSQLEKLAIGKF